MARLRTGRALAALAGAGLALSACGTGGAVAHARAACVKVDAALVLYAKSERPGIDAATKDSLAARAMASLLAATPEAAAATSADGSWNPLMTTIGEAQRVPIGNLVPALTRLCAVANSSQ
ncbi:MAG TPA: hypothetical protein VLS91_07495, partial [Acidimicrobiales bacterium]|nr:hypothetical protein [Acidimicrobiales bacterium]